MFPIKAESAYGGCRPNSKSNTPVSRSSSGFRWGFFFLLKKFFFFFYSIPSSGDFAFFWASVNSVAKVPLDWGKWIFSA